MAGFVIEGLEDALRKMDEMTKNVAKKHVKKALRAAAKPVLQSAKDNAKKIDDPKTSADISKNLVIRAGKTIDKNSAKVRIGIRGGAYADTKENRRKGRVGQETANIGSKSNPGGDTYYWRFIEFGTSRMAAIPFMRPAMESNIQNATDIFAESLKADLMGDIR